MYQQPYIESYYEDESSNTTLYIAIGFLIVCVIVTIVIAVMLDPTNDISDSSTADPPSSTSNSGYDNSGYIPPTSTTNPPASMSNSGYDNSGYVPPTSTTDPPASTSNSGYVPPASTTVPSTSTPNSGYDSGSAASSTICDLDNDGSSCDKTVKYWIKNVKHGGYLSSEDGKVPIHSKDQPDDFGTWKIINIPDGNVFVIANVGSGLILNAGGDGGKTLKLVDKQYTASQWMFMEDPNNKGVFHIGNVGWGLKKRIVAPYSFDGTVFVSSEDTGDHSQWKIVLAE